MIEGNCSENMFFSFTRELDVEAGYVVSALLSLFFSPSLFSELSV